MSNNKRTSIDFLFDNLQNKAKGKLKTISKEELLIIAKEIHKQEIIDAWELSRYRLNYNHTGEEHFNVTFKQ